MYVRNPTTVTVTTLDLSSIVEKATAAINDDPARYRLDPPAEGEKLVAEVNLTHGIVETPEGIYVLCDEGVGNAEPVGEDGEVFDIHVKRLSNEGKTTSFSMFPVASFTLSVEELREHATGDERNLSDFIRTFGSRLDSNYEMWRKLLEEKVAA